MGFDPIRAEMRFGYGRSPVIGAPTSIDAMLEGVAGPDVMAERFAIAPFEEVRARVILRRALRKQIKATDASQAERDAAITEQKALYKAAYQDGLHWLRQTMQRRVWTSTGFRERLATFWGDHFTAYGKMQVLRAGTGPYLDEAIRPNLAGRFEEYAYRRRAPSADAAFPRSGQIRWPQ